MAKTPLNSALGELRGKIDGFVYRQLGGETIVSGLPESRGRVRFDQLSPSQDQFQDAVLYAQAVCEDPARRAAYARIARRRRVRAGRLFAFIVGDYLAPPVVTEIRIRDYRRRAGDRIVVFAKDDCEVVSVEVALKDAAGAILESGPATATPLGWRYVAKADAPADAPLTIVATAKDRAGNKTVAEQPAPVASAAPLY